MKTTGLWLSAMVVILIAGSGPADGETALGTAFTYQGRLTDGGVAVTGVYEFEFKLYDAHADPSNQVGSTFSLRSVLVTNGLFTVKLDFGSDVFNGNARWLQIAVRPQSTADPHTVLSPRQELTPAPYTLYAMNGGGGLWAANGDDIHNTNSGKVGVGTSSPNFNLEVYDSGGPNTPPTTFGVHWVQPALPQSLRNWFYFAVGGSTPTVGTGTRLIRKSGTDLHFQTREGISSGLPSTQMVLDDAGKLGIGTMWPAGLLHLSSLDGIDLIVEADTNNAGGEDQNARLVLKQDGSQVVGRIGYRSGLNKLEIMQEYGDSLILGTNNVDRITITSSGQVGIGTSTIPAGVVLAVDGKALFEEVEVQLSGDWPDYVFEDDYELMSLDDLAASVRETKHLPGIPSAREVERNGVSIGQMQADLLRKVEELTLYVIDLDKQLNEVKQENETFRAQLSAMEGVGR